jgi:DNA-damage-inducible protein J
MQYEQLNVRMPKDTKAAAESVFAELGLSATDAVRMFYKQVALRQGLPFEATLLPPTSKNSEDFDGRLERNLQKHSATLEGLAKR